MFIFLQYLLSHSAGKRKKKRKKKNRKKNRKRFRDDITRRNNPKSSFNEPYCLKILNNMEKEK